MKRPRLNYLAAVFIAALFPSSGWSAALADANAPPPAATPDNSAAAPEDATAHFSAPVRQVTKMIKAGVPIDVVKAYVDNSASTFNLTPDGIIQLQNMGIPGTAISEMLSHDTVLRDNASGYASQFSQPMFPAQPPTGYPGAEPAQPDYGTGESAMDDNYYNDLSPYGNWDYMNGYGWGWQPDSWLWPYYSSWEGYPWWGYGRWWNCPGRGWCWFPGRGFRGFGAFRGDFNRFHNEFGRFQQNRNFFAGRNGFAGQNSFRTFGGRSFGFNHSLGMNRSFGGARGFSPGMGGGHFGGHAGGFGGGTQEEEGMAGAAVVIADGC